MSEELFFRTVIRQIAPSLACYIQFSSGLRVFFHDRDAASAFRSEKAAHHARGPAADDHNLLQMVSSIAMHPEQRWPSRVQIPSDLRIDQTGYALFSLSAFFTSTPVS